MLFLLAQLGVLLILAIAIGFFLGWMYRNVTTRTQLRLLEQEWGTRMRNLRMQRDKLQVHTEKLSKRITEAQVEHARTTALIDTLKARIPKGEDGALGEMRKRMGELEQLAQRQKQQLGSLSGKLELRDVQLRELRDQLHDAEHGRTHAEGELRDTRMQSEHLRAALAKAATHKARAAQKKAGASKINGTQGANASKLGAAPGKAPEGLWQAAPPRVDRLQRINGIGPVLERLLNRLGIYQFRQIARMSEDNVLWLGKHINSFPQRIERENWVTQAQDLHAETYPSESL